MAAVSDDEMDRLILEATQEIRRRDLLARSRRLLGFPGLANAVEMLRR